MGVELPAALVALVAAAIPLALALRARSPSRVAPFPSVELVREVTGECRRERGPEKDLYVFPGLVEVKVARRCAYCGSEFSVKKPLHKCPNCGGELELVRE